MFEQFRQRSYEFERLDTGDYTSEEYAVWLGEMRRIHNFFGELRALKKTLLREVENSVANRVSILDVGAGNGYILGELAKQMNGRQGVLVGVELSTEAAASIPSFGASAVQIGRAHV